MSRKDEAEKILADATGETQPLVGDTIVWIDKGYRFIPSVFIGVGLDTVDTVPYALTVTSGVYELLGTDAITGDADLFDRVRFERIFLTRREDNGGGDREPTGEIFINEHLAGFVRFSLNMEYSGANNRLIDISLGWRRDTDSTDIIYGTPLTVQTSNAVEHLGVSFVFKVPAGGLIGIYLRGTSATQVLTITDLNWQLEFAGI